MERERPPYLSDLPRDRRGNWPMYVLAGALLIALVGGWRIYADTVSAWHIRYNAPPPPAQQTRAAAPAPVRHAPMMVAPAAPIDRSGWRCVGNTPFRPLPGGGWENVPGEWCVSSQR